MCNCKKTNVVAPEPTPTPQTPEELHTLEMNNYAKKLSEQEIDWFNNIDTIKPINNG